MKAYLGDTKDNGRNVLKHAAYAGKAGMLGGPSADILDWFRNINSLPLCPM